MNISTLNASGESYFACSSDDMILGPGECIDKAPGLNSLHPPFSPRLAAYRWGQQRQRSRGKLSEIFWKKIRMHEYVCVDKSVLLRSAIDDLSALGMYFCVDA